MALFTRVCTGRNSLNGLLNRLCKVSKYNNVQVAHISGRANRIHVPRPPPFPYRKKGLGIIDGFFGYNIERFDENSRIIVVEGPIAAGKDKFARELAIELDMGYMSPPTFDILYGDGCGNDIRKMNHTVPERLQACDIETFLTNPKHAGVPAFELSYYLLKLGDYCESLLHVLSTGEGVVLNRCLFSNFVFMKAMYNAGYINQRCRDFYDKVVYEVTRFVMKPHLVIYLDIPVNVVQERIKKRAIPYEVNSKVLTKEFLTDIETIYKEEYLPQIEDHSYLLMYDWVESIDITDVVDDIERIHMEYDSQYPRKLADWTFGSIADLQARRHLYSRQERDYIMTQTLIEDFEVSEMYYSGEDCKAHDEHLRKNFSKYTLGYNADKGDKVLWKNKVESDAYFHRVITHKELLETQ